MKDDPGMQMQVKPESGPARVKFFGTVSMKQLSFGKTTKRKKNLHRQFPRNGFRLTDQNNSSLPLLSAMAEKK